MDIKKGDRIYIDGTIAPAMVKLGFHPETANSIAKRWCATYATAREVWEDKDQKYVTVDMCVEIPIECCRPA